MKASINQSFYCVACWVYAHPKKILFINLVIVFALMRSLSDLQVDMSTEAMLHDDDPVLLHYQEFTQQFGRDDGIALLFPLPASDYLKTLDSLVALHKDLEFGVPYITEINSLYNARYTYGEDGELLVDDLLEGWPEQKKSQAQIQAIIHANPAYENTLISKDGRYSAVFIKLNPYFRPEGADQIEKMGSPQNAEAVAAVKKIITEYPHLNLQMGGTAFVEDTFNTTTKADAKLAVMLRFIAVVVILAIFFRRVSGVVLPLLVIILSLLSTFGLMAMTGTPFTATSNIIIPLLMAVGTCDAIHILAIFYKRFETSGDKKEAIIGAITHSAPAILLTSLTTGAALMSFYWAEIAAVAQLGFITAAAVAFAFIYTVLLLPALIAIFPMKQRSGVKEKRLLDNCLLAFARTSEKYANSIVMVGVAVFIASLLAFSNLRFSMDNVQYFPENHAVSQSVASFDQHLGGASSMELIIDTQQPFGLYDPEFMLALEGLEQRLLSAPIAGILIHDTVSILDVLRETNRALMDNAASAYQIPETRELIAQELLLFENSGSNDLSELVDGDYQIMRMTLKIPHSDGVDQLKTMREVELLAASLLPGSEVVITGNSSLQAYTVPKVLRSMSLSYVIAFLLICILMVTMAGHLQIGLASMLPNLLPITLMLSVMAVFDIPLDSTSIMIFSIAIGIVVDDTLHFIYQYTRYSKEGQSNLQAIENTLLTTGRAIWVTSCILFVAFFVNISATLENVSRFGLLIALVVVLALLADLLLAPALMTVIRRWEVKKQRVPALANSDMGEMDS
ncbi:MAG: MMPL family transporter [Pseudomonadales bacterium]|nr:MMPL family transporter [Pseudomonadales bacterium]